MMKGASHAEAVPSCPGFGPLLGLSLSATTWAQSAPSAGEPTSSDDCLKIAFDLAQTAEEKKLPS